ncbi:hypothetical protein E2562_017868 [Oryza meyeriana var. granulata]|uniref:DUF834 domain-containing protein n=1 Tax=Oryza meyeriana var. granulata TaxID=110450 RepID=A0A6G1DYW4_9ORYZ|nr:hypothetical protein E2562_017868 [Oryza meyeriana var. granulata]
MKRRGSTDAYRNLPRLLGPPVNGLRQRLVVGGEVLLVAEIGEAVEPQVEGVDPGVGGGIVLVDERGDRRGYCQRRGGKRCGRARARVAEGMEAMQQVRRRGTPWRRGG